MKRFLIIQTAFLGDVVLATPVITALKNRYPNAQIDVLVRKGNESLLSNNPFLENVYTFNKKEGKWKEILRLIKLFRSKKYDEIINLQRFASSGMIATFSKAKRVSGFKKNPFSLLYTNKYAHEIGNGTHEITRNLNCISTHTDEKFILPSLFPSEHDWNEISTYTSDKFVCLAPASVWFTKQLPKSKWIELGQKLIAFNMNIFLLGAPNDHQLLEEIRNGIGNENCLNLAGKLSLLQSAALISKAEHSFVNDSGPMHLASAMNAHVTAFFCSTVPSFGFGPVSDHSFVAETSEKLACRPCGLHGYKTCPKGHFKCGDIDLNTMPIWKDFL